MPSPRRNSQLYLKSQDILQSLSTRCVLTPFSKRHLLHSYLYRQMAFPYLTSCSFGWLLNSTPTTTTTRTTCTHTGSLSALSGIQKTKNVASKRDIKCGKKSEKGASPLVFLLNFAESPQQKSLPACTF